MPAKAGIQNYLKKLDSCLRENDVKGRFKTFYESINIDSDELFHFAVLLSEKSIHGVRMLFPFDVSC
jgi:hypothetical protein